MRTCLLLVFAMLLARAASGAELANGIYVIVNDAVITYQEVEEAIAPLARILADQYRNQPEVFEQKLQQIRTEKIEELVERELILHEFKTAGYQLPESIIDDVIRDRIKADYGDRATLTKTLQREGMTFETYRKQVREAYIVRAMIQFKISSEKVVISPQKIEDYYNEHRELFHLEDQIKLRMIVLNKTGVGDELPAKLGEEILSKLREGAAFPDMAAIYSDVNRDKGGDRGWVDRKLLKKELTDAAFALKKGQYSGVIDQPEACYILFAEDVQSAHVRPLADVRADIEKTLKNEEQTRLKNKWIERLKAKSYIRYY